jgi:hypothetical protein
MRLGVGWEDKLWRLSWRKWGSTRCGEFRTLQNTFIDYWQSFRISILGPRDQEALVLTDGQSDVAGTIRARRIYFCDGGFVWKIWILSFQAETTQTLTLDGCAVWERRWGCFYFQTVETGSLNIEVLKVCSVSLRGGILAGVNRCNTCRRWHLLLTACMIEWLINVNWLSGRVHYVI